MEDQTSCTDGSLFDSEWVPKFHVPHSQHHGLCPKGHKMDCRNRRVLSADWINCFFCQEQVLAAD
eukprot:12882803-Prorocentrum_lima.AAC.1